MSSIPVLNGKLESLSPSTIKKERVLSAVLAIGLGMVLIFGVGFTETDVLHNAAHDVRHAAAIPCH